ncbi:MAG: hypothetical protein KY475_09560 [Planctomycetes bacterium]|nr:hypothetical protein [Planctomycetota bacterium]
MAEEGAFRVYSYGEDGVIRVSGPQGGADDPAFRIYQHNVEILDKAREYALEACRIAKTMLQAISEDCLDRGADYIRHFVSQASWQDSLHHRLNKADPLIQPVATPFVILTAAGAEQAPSAHLAAQALYERSERCLRALQMWFGISLATELDAAHWREICEDEELRSLCEVDGEALEAAIRAESSAATERCRTSATAIAAGRDAPAAFGGGALATTLSAKESDVAKLPLDGSVEVSAVRKKSKRSTQRGDAREKLIAALTKHHEYANGSCLNQEPIANNALARLAGVAKSSASEFFKDEFKGYGLYRRNCQDITTLVGMLKMVNGEFRAFELYGHCPPGEGEDED